jgi:putative restriction endonuclease
VEAGDPVLHLRGIGAKAAFVGFSIADSNGFETSDRPPDPEQWGYSSAYYRVLLKDFNPFAAPIFLRDVFSARDTELRKYFEKNKLKTRKERLFYVINADRLQYLQGACLSEVSSELSRLLLGQ